MEMNKYLFSISVPSFGGVNIEEVVEIPHEATEADIEEEFTEWVFEQIDANYMKLEK